MGIENYSGNTLWLTVSCGKMVNKKKEISANAYTGTIKKIETKSDEYEGKEIEKVIVSMKDGEDSAKIQFTMESWYSVGFFDRIEGVNLSEPCTIGVMPSDQNEKMSFCWIKQNGETIKKADKLKPEKIKIGNKKEISDYTKFIEAVHGIIEKINTTIGVKVSDDDAIKDEDGNVLF